MSEGAARAPIIGLFGRPFVDLEHLLDAAALAEMDREITRGLVRVTPSYTGGSLKWMGVVAPWRMADGFVDLMHAVQGMSREELAELAALGDTPVDLDSASPPSFGDETEHPLNLAQMRWLSFRHGVYFPWKVCVHLLENERWEDKHRGAGKDFTAEAKALFPRTVARIQSLPFREIGRVRDLRPGAQRPRPSAPRQRAGKGPVGGPVDIDLSARHKRFYLQNGEGDPPFVLGARVYWFNDMDYHGVLADPFFRYSVRVDGVFEPAFLRDVERAARRPRGSGERRRKG